ncbi:trypsin-like peptidase domain-containing protein [Streptomyces sp. NPDC050803]|uniref:nSTAND1 domain-containing NTPase n=1 Tax=unclassified Streptomyces TaxID=2593676 RepID=UPI00342EBBF5
MDQDLAACCAAVRGADDTKGTAFLLSREHRLLATCAHVVDYAGAGPGEWVSLRLPAGGEEIRAYVVPDRWRPADAEDVAILRVAEDLPDEFAELPLGTSTDATGHPCRTFGFPPDKPLQGLAGSGTVLARIRDESGRQILQLTDAPEITPGFSGGPLHDPLARRVVGMVVSILAPDEFGRLVTTAFAVPVETLAGLCPELTVSDVSPYRGLEPFRETESEFFFGREDAVRRMLTLLRQDPRFLPVLGPSGSGKSSLVQAGLLPRLREGAVPGAERWRLMVTRPARLHELETSLPGVSADIGDAARRWLDLNRDAERLLLVVDQFEEIFLSGDDASRARFLEQLARAVDDPALPLGVILTMRDEFYSRLVREAPAFGRMLEEGLCNVPPTLDQMDLADIVERPALRLGLRFEAGLVDRIVHDTVRLSPAPVDDGALSTVLPLLQFALGELWEGRRDGVLQHLTYERMQGVGGGLSRWADRALERIDSAQMPLARRGLRLLVHLGDESQGTPDSRWRRPIAALAAEEERAPMAAVMGRLADERIVVTSLDRQSGEEMVELIHDALLREWGTLKHWIRTDREFLGWLQGLEQQRHSWWQSDGPDGHDTGRLLRGRDLDTARRMLAERAVDLTPAQREYITLSQQAWDREQNRLREALTEADRQRELAERRLAAAVIREQAARALTLLPLQPVAGLVTAADAVLRNLAELPADMLETAQISLHAALYQSRERGVAAEHTAPVTGLSVSPDGLLIASSGMDRTVRLWDVQGRSVGWPLTGPEDAVTCVAFHPDGRLIAAGGGDCTVRVWDLNGRQVRAPLEGHEDTVTALAHDPHGRLLATGGADRTIRLWHPDGTPAGPPLTGHQDAVTCLAFDADGRLASGSADRTVRLWNTDDGTELALLPGHEDSVTCLAFGAQGRLASGGADRTVRLWNRDGRPVGTPFTGHEDAVTCLAFDAGAGRLVTGSLDRTIRLWDRRGRAQHTPMIGHTDAVTAVSCTPDGRTIVSGGTDRTVRFWDTEGFGADSVIAAHPTDVNGIALIRGDQLLLSGSADGTIRAWTREGQPVGPAWVGHDGFVYDLAAHDTAERVASAGADGTVRLWDLNARAVASPLTGHRGPVNAVALSPDGTVVASGGADRTLRLWRTTGEPLGAPLEGHEDEVRGLTFSPEGTVLASAAADGTVRRWSTAGDALGPPLTGHEGEVRDLVFSPDGTSLATVGLDGTLRLWTAEGEPLGEPARGHAGGVYAVRFTPDGAHLLTGGADATLRLWSRRGLPASEPFRGHRAPVWRVEVGQDGRFVVSGGEDGSLRTWDAGWRAWLEQAARRLAGHPGPGGVFQQTFASVNARCTQQPWLDARR